ncbi:MAG: hypothetical protein ACLUD1_07315 [Clostridia bacterium]
MTSIEPYNGIIEVVQLSRNFESKNNYTNVVSTLCYGVRVNR